MPENDEPKLKLVSDNADKKEKPSPFTILISGLKLHIRNPNQLNAYFYLVMINGQLFYTPKENPTFCTPCWCHVPLDHIDKTIPLLCLVNIPNKGTAFIPIVFEILEQE